MSPRTDSLTIGVTGAEGFVGRKVVAIAAERGHRVVAISRRAGDVVGAERSLSADLRREWPDTGPLDAVIHLAGLAAVGPSFADPAGYLSDNGSIVATLGEWALGQEVPPRIIGVSSGAVYAPSDSPLPEDAEVQFASPYVVSKMLVENLLTYYGQRGLDVVAARPFNHIGPGQGPGFLIPDLYDAVDATPEGDAVVVGDLSTRRDYCDARDVARAYVLLAERSRTAHALYNVASGRSLSGRDILEMICAAMGREVPAIATDQSRLRPNDNPRVEGSAERLRADTGWMPDIPVERSIADYVEWRREEAREGGAD